MKAKMTVYQNGGKAPITPDPKKKEMAELGKKLFGPTKPVSKEQFRVEMLQRQIGELEKEKNSWINKGQSKTASGVNAAIQAKKAKLADAKAKLPATKPEQTPVWMPKKYSGGGKMNVAGFANGGKFMDYLKKLKK